LLAITTQPTAQTATAGGTATFGVAASGSTAVGYQWRKDGVALAGIPSATTATLVLANVQSANGGSYDVVVTNASGSINSQAVLLTVNATVPVNPTASPTITVASPSVAATAGAPFRYAI
jgi:hypothetical protein